MVPLDLAEVRGRAEVRLLSYAQSVRCRAGERQERHSVNKNVSYCQFLDGVDRIFVN